ncbi:MAG: non-homologous end-joining DNA ligase [Bdellovibrionales bacterium]|nr:non-homologous end-joining DNA ligase [Bdellovibrionales bacterium]
MKTETQRMVGKHRIALSNLDKEFFPASDLTKGDVVDYYERIADYLLPYLKDRPLSMQRFPDGLDGAGFYQKQAPDYFPSWITTTAVPVGSAGKTQWQVVCNDAATLVYLANQGCLTLHPWLSRRDKLQHPDLLVFDLDPSRDDFSQVQAAARVLKAVFDELGVETFVRLTGSRGAHVVIPLDRKAEFDSVRTFAKKIAEQAVQRAPTLLTLEHHKKKRGSRVFVDYLRNAYGQTIVAPYALRARAGAPVAAPLRWEELLSASMEAQRYTMENIFRRLAQTRDPWAELFRRPASLKSLSDRLARVAA